MDKADLLDRLEALKLDALSLAECLRKYATQQENLVDELESLHIRIDRYLSENGK